MLAPLLAVLLSAPAEPVPLASIGLQGPPSKSELIDSLSATLALRMSETGLVRVTTPADVAAVLGMERQKQLLGCTESNCVAELAGALGAKALVTGELAVVGEILQLSVRVIDATSARPLFQALERHRDAASLLSAIDRLAIAAADAVGERFGLTTRPSGSPGKIVLFAGGGALAVAGGVLLGLAKVDEVALRDGTVTTPQLAERRVADGELKQALGLGLLAGGVVASTAALIWTLAGVTAPVAIVPTHHGLAVGGHF